MVVLAFTIGNDFLDNSKTLDGTKVRPFFELRQGKLVLDNSFRQRPEFIRLASWSRRFGRALSDYSRVVQLIYRVKVVLETKKKRSPDDNPCAPPVDPVWRDTWQLTEALLLEMHSEVSAAGADFLVMVIPDVEQVYPDRSHRDRVMARWGISDLLYADKQLQAFGDREHMAVLDLGPAFQAYADSHHVFLNGFSNDPGEGHWGSLGHRLAGQMLAHRLCETVLTDRQPRLCPGSTRPLQ